MLSENGNLLIGSRVRHTHHSLIYRTKSFGIIVVPNLFKSRLLLFKCLVARAVCSIRSVRFPSQSFFCSIFTKSLFYASSSEPFLGMGAEIATFLSPCSIHSAKSCIFDAISDGNLFDLRSFVPICKITSSGFLSSGGFEWCFICLIVEPPKAFTVIL